MSRLGMLVSDEGMGCALLWMKMMGEVVQFSMVRSVVPTNDSLPALKQGVRVAAGLRAIEKIELITAFQGKSDLGGQSFRRYNMDAFSLEKRR